MDILAAIPVYNEIDYLPMKMKWCEANGISMYVLDNYSTDGTWEYIQNNNDRLVSAARIDTKNSFDLRLIQARLMKAVHILKPDWLVYVGADLFLMVDGKLSEFIENVDKQGFNTISLPVCNFNNTGEKAEIFDPLNTYFYIGEVGPRVNLMVKYIPKMEMKGDFLNLPDKKVYEAEGIAFNFGFTKSIERRKETLARREKAWKAGLRAQTGRHYRRAAERNFTWKKEECIHVKDSPYYSYWLQLKQQVE